MAVTARVPVLCGERPLSILREGIPSSRTSLVVYGGSKVFSEICSEIFNRADVTAPPIQKEGLWPSELQQPR